MTNAQHQPPAAPERSGGDDGRLDAVVGRGPQPMDDELRRDQETYVESCNQLERRT